MNHHSCEWALKPRFGLPTVDTREIARAYVGDRAPIIFASYNG